MRSMQPSERQQSPYEVHCNHCRVTFPVGTKRCVHCGGRVGPWAPPGQAPAEPEAPAEDQPPDEINTLRKVAGAVLWILLAAVAIAVRICGER